MVGRPRPKFVKSKVDVPSVPKTAIFWCLGVLALSLVASFGWQNRAVAYSVGEEFVAATIGASVDKILVEGTQNTDPKMLKLALQLEKGESLVGFDVASARERLERLPWVKLAAVKRQLPGTLEVDVYEYTPLANLHTENGEVWVVDKAGVKIIPTNEKFSSLPTINGEGAELKASNLFAKLLAQPKIASKLAKATYVGSRRWDLEFVGGFKVKLPEHGEINALNILAKLEDARHVLALNGGHLDMRMADRLALKLPKDDSLSGLVL